MLLEDVSWGFDVPIAVDLLPKDRVYTPSFGGRQQALFIMPNLPAKITIFCQYSARSICWR
jgi:hypothetical protein